MKLFSFFLLLSFFICLSSSPTFAAVVVGETCDTLGTSTMTSDQKDIATCLKNDSGGYVWKSMSSSAGKGSLCGLAVITTTTTLTDHGACGRGCTGSSVSHDIACEGQSIYPGCPSGYTGRSGTSSSVSDYHGNEGTGTSISHFFCVKD